jgi:RNA polymerase sigma-70 factor (ECF subfamily)
MALLDGDEQASLEAAQSGSVSDFESLFRTHWPRAFRVSYLVVLDHAAAEEIVLESFLGAVRSLDAYGHERPFTPWLHRLVVNRSIDRSRARLLQPSGIRSRAAGESTEPLEWAVPIGGPHLDPAARALAAGLFSLSPDLRAGLVLRYLLDYSPAEMARVLDVTKEVVDSRLDLGRQRLRAQLDGIAPLDEKTLRTLLLQQPVPGEHLALERTWEVVRAAFLAREPAPPARRRFPVRTTAAILALAAIGVAVWLTGAGAWIADRFQTGDDGEAATTATATPAAGSQPLGLPAAGRLLVTGDGSVEVLDADGARTTIGEYGGASWSSSGRFVAAWRKNLLVGLDVDQPDLPLWQVGGKGIADARWSDDGFRVAYRARSRLRVVDGSGNDPRILSRDAAPVAPAWRPGDEHVLAYAEGRGRVRVVDVDTRDVVWQLPAADVVALEWSGEGTQLAVLAADELSILDDRKRVRASVRLPADVRAVALAVRPGASPDVAYSVVSPTTGRGSVFVFDAGSRASELVFAGPGRFGRLVWSPDGRYLLVPWRAGNQWLFVPVGAGELTITEDPATELGTTAFPRPGGWCCAP